jgi:anti-sigma factor RsiW
MNRVDDVMLMAYVDGEVDAATAREIEAAMAADPAVAARAQRMRDGAAITRSAFADVLHEPVPDRLIAALAGGGTLGAATAAAAANVVRLEPRKSGATTMGGGVMGWAMAAGLAALIVGYSAGRYTNLVPTAGDTPIQVASTTPGGPGERWLDHVAGIYQVYTSSLAQKDKLLVDFSAEDVPELEKYFGTKLNRKLAVPDLSQRGFAPQGGRLLIIGGKPAAQFLYTSTTGDLVALVVAHSEAPYLPAQADRRGDVNIVHWRNNGYAYAFAGTIDHQKLQEIADRVWRDLERAS